MITKLLRGFLALMLFMGAITFFRPLCAYKAYVHTQDPALAGKIILKGPQYIASLYYSKLIAPDNPAISAKADGPIFPPDPNAPWGGTCCYGYVCPCTCYNTYNPYELIRFWQCSLCYGGCCPGGGQACSG